MLKHNLRTARFPARQLAASVFIAVVGVILAGAALAAEIELNGHVFSLPEGFVIERVAGPPLVDRPVTADFDDEGRLYVADSSGTSDNVQKQLAEKPHRIVRLEDTDGDGRFDRRTIFADSMMFPEGTLWFDGSLYVSAPPSIWKLTDTDGDGVADERVEWFQGKTLTGCANDLHGPYLGPDGWIYWCKGAFAEQTYERPGREPLVTRAAHIFRCRPDGSGIEPVMTGGMDNPVDVVFTPGGERIFTTTFLQHPGGGNRDGLIHAVYGGVYGKVHNVLDGHPRTSEEVMPVLVHLGPAAPCGLARYESDAFGTDYRDNLFAALFNMRKITRHIVRPAGAALAATQEDFLVSNNLDFHPTDVVEDADGTIVVVDTGGWYKLCCPTSQLGKPDVLGAIYRVSRREAKRADDPRGKQLVWRDANTEELVSRLDDRRPAVRRRTFEALAKAGDAAVPDLEKCLATRGKEPATRDRNVVARLNAVWAVCRIDSPKARQALCQALDDDDETVRQAAIHAVSVYRVEAALPQLFKLLKGPSLQNRRAAAEAIGRLGGPSAVPELLAAFAAHPLPAVADADANLSRRVLDHSSTYALIEIGDRTGTAAGLRHADVRVRAGALMALDQMPGGALKTDVVTPLLSSADEHLRQRAVWIVGHHPEWAGELAGYYRERLATSELSASDRADLEGQLARIAAAPEIERLLAERLSDNNAPIQERMSVLRAMTQSGLKELPGSWAAGLVQMVGDGAGDLQAPAIAALRALPAGAAQAGQVKSALLQLANADSIDDANRLAALAALPGGMEKVPDAIFTLLVDRLDPEQPVAVRSTAVEVLAKAKLNPNQLGSLTEAMEHVGPLEVDRLLAVFEQTTDAAVGRKLLSALSDSPAFAALSVGMLKPRLAKFPQEVQDEAEELYARLDRKSAESRARLEELIESLPEGDVRRGQLIFNSTKAACSSCHAIGYLGGKLGPDLTRIGQVRQRRDLLESIVFPSASFVRSYEPVMVVTANGRIESGLLRKDSPDEVVLAKSATEDVRIARAEIEEMLPGTVSIMPQGLDRQLSAGELADLVAFLQACK